MTSRKHMLEIRISDYMAPGTVVVVLEIWDLNRFKKAKDLIAVMLRIRHLATQSKMLVPNQV